MKANPSRFRRFLQFLRLVPRPRPVEGPPKPDGLWATQFQTSIVRDLDPSVTTEPKIEVVIQVPLLGRILTFKRRVTQTDPGLVEAVIEDLRIHLLDTLNFYIDEETCCGLRNLLRIQLIRDETVRLPSMGLEHE